ncbi:enoyl-CoA hydratase-related protein [Allorhizobium borbori]|uniref:Enoyl-CoA hydratase n=1 Tax=Allorhizobium borbori TaxID=485907 RepID=A0A7W6K5M1_9HYPH|nr:enoyl-CoA hydratase-related protein [Allorhizobium borbori]MBB4105550.1 enoyl-CoA hydratase [Allorhizobium borbori]PZU21298.1 MAG: enoyl-CoA hydratase [Shinella sp.]
MTTQLSDRLKVTKADKIATITIDNPPVNVVTLALYKELADLFQDASNWTDVNCIVLTGSGRKAFCAGLDLNEFLAATVEEDPYRARIIRRCFENIRKCALPTIAAVNGPALGAGAVIASVCDIRLATENARFGLPEINVGRCGATAHMGRHLPQGVLRRMFFTGLPISAQEAERWGFVDRIVSHETLMDEALALAAIIAAKAPLGLRLGKEALNAVEFMTVEDGYQLEQGFSTRLMTTEDAREATRAVVEKRAPAFQGR